MPLPCFPAGIFGLIESLEGESLSLSFRWCNYNDIIWVSFLNSFLRGLRDSKVSKSLITFSSIFFDLLYSLIIYFTSKFVLLIFDFSSILELSSLFKKEEGSYWIVYDFSDSNICDYSVFKVGSCEYEWPVTFLNCILKLCGTYSSLN